MSCGWPATPWTSADGASSRTPAGTAAAPATRYASRRTLHTGAGLLTDKQQTKLLALFTTDKHAAVEVTWSVYHQTGLPQMMGTRLS